MITVKDIREKEFSRQKHGYHEDEVDDFLDEIADQMEELIRENRSLLGQLEEAKTQASDAAAQDAANYQQPQVEQAQYAAPAKAVDQPPVDEPSYFRNLEATLRETLISAQRIADNTVAEARTKAKELVSNAEEQARKIAQEATTATANAKQELENLKKAYMDYKSRFLRMVKDQMAAINIDESEIEEQKEDEPEAK